MLALSHRVAIELWRLRASLSFFCSLAISSSDARSAASSTAIWPLSSAILSVAFWRSTRAALARSSRSFDSASSAFSVQPCSRPESLATWRRISFWSAMVRAAEARTSTNVSSISRMIMRIIFAGSSALSKRSVKLAAMMSRVREKLPMFVTPRKSTLYSETKLERRGGQQGGGPPRRRAPSKYYFDGTRWPLRPGGRGNLVGLGLRQAGAERREHQRRSADQSAGDHDNRAAETDRNLVYCLTP